MQVFSNGKKLFLYLDDNSIYTFDDIFVKSFNIEMRQPFVDIETFGGYKEKMASGPAITEISLQIIGYTPEIRDTSATSMNLIDELIKGMKAEKAIKDIESLPIKEKFLRSLSF